VRRYQEKLRAYRDRLERRPRVAFLLQVNRRFKKIEGKHLALVISLNLFVAVIPLLIIIYAFVAAFSANRSFGTLLARDLHLTGNSALVVRDTFTNAKSGKSVALSISLISLLVTGLDVSATAQVALFWIWIAAVMGVYWERKAGPAAVAAMEELSAEISASEPATVSKQAAS
jgi:uncharacterized BrkB/YihY/UPF0761 family membrane protein